MSEGIASANKQMLAEQTLAADTGLRQRALNLTEQQMRNSQQQQGIERFDKQIADTMSVVAETIKSATAVGRDPQTIMKAVVPLVQSAKAIAARVGRDPNALDAQVKALIVNPSMIETATATGTAAATQAVAQDTAERNLLRAQQPAGEGSADPELKPRYKTAKEKFDAENALRDDFVKNSKEFITVRDYYSNFKQAEASGAGDITRVFSFMKIMDPGSVVMPGEQANANNAAGVPEAVRGMYNKLVGGGTLSPEARKQIGTQVENIYSARAKQHDKTQTQFAGIAKRQGLNPNNVLIDLGMVKSPAAEPPAGGGNGSLPPPPPGFKLVP